MATQQVGTIAWGSLSFEMPLHTCSEKNVREHWSTRARRVKAQRVATGVYFRMQPYAMRTRVVMPLVVTLTRLAPRALDDDNLARGLSAVRDEIAAQLGVDDRTPEISWVYMQWRGDPRQYGVKIEIQPREVT